MTALTNRPRQKPFPLCRHPDTAEHSAHPCRQSASFPVCFASPPQLPRRLVHMYRVNHALMYLAAPGAEGGVELRQMLAVTM